MLWNRIKCKFLGHAWNYEYWRHISVCMRCGEAEEGDNLYDE